MVTSYFDVIEEACIARDDIVARVPGYFQIRVLTQVLGQCRHVLRLAVPSHETDTGHLSPVLGQQSIQGGRIQCLPDIVPQMRAVAPYTSVRTMRYIHRKGHLIGDFLEDNIVVVVF